MTRTHQLQSTFGFCFRSSLATRSAIWLAASSNAALSDGAAVLGGSDGAAVRPSTIWIRVTGTHHREIYAHLLPRIDIAGQGGHCFDALGADDDTSSLRELYYLGQQHVDAVLRGALFHSVILQLRFEGHWLNYDRTLSVGLQSFQIPNDLITSPWASYLITTTMGFSVPKAKESSLRQAHAFEQVDVARIRVKGLKIFFGLYVFHAPRPLRVPLFQPFEGVVAVSH